jgi:DNA-binding NarL/FixJ family response regulator
MPWSVLVVDDDASFRQLATRTLRSWGYAVVGEAGTVAEAIERADELRPDAALVDIGLPDGDGFWLTEQLRALAWPVRVVLISSDGDRANGLAAERAGASGFFPKDELAGSPLRRLIEGR